jgi:oligopeptide/dipeptide ABC transporter ATP-binding protein
MLQIVDRFTFSIARGEVFALVGESGSGKTVVARSIMRLYPPGVLRIDGSLMLEGLDIAKADSTAMRRVRGSRVGMIFQEPMTSLNPLMTVEEQISEAMRSHGAVPRRDRVQQLLSDVRFDRPAQVAQMYPHELSGGMRQRVMIAIALANDPPLLIADEPTTALDVTIQHEIMEILMRLRASYNLSVLLISHNLGLVNRYANTIGVLYGGALMEIGPTAQVIRRPSHPYTRGLLDCLPRARRNDQRQTGLDGTVPRVDEWFAGCRFAPRCWLRQHDCATDAIAMSPVDSDREVRCLHPL